MCTLYTCQSSRRGASAREVAAPMGPESKRRAPLTRAAVLAAAVALADRDGLDAVSMRNGPTSAGSRPCAAASSPPGT